LEERVELTGWQSNSQVRALIREARALILPSFAEGLPVVLMEALALGRPVIATYVAGIPELVTDQICGWLVPAGSIEQLARAIRQCLDAPDILIQRMGMIGRRRVLERHDIAKESRKLADLFRGKASVRPASEEPPPVDDLDAADEVVPAHAATLAGGRSNVVTLFSTHSAADKR
jgi:glycosyltransferase involved in cell wall biosynthesis